MPKKGEKKPKGKWGHLVGVLPKITTEAPERIDQIDVLRAQLIEDYQTQQTAERLYREGKMATLEDAIKAVSEGWEERDNVVPPTGYLVDSYLALRDAKAAIKNQLADIELELDALTKMIDDAYEAEGISSLHTTDGASVGRHYEPYAVVKDNDALRAWAIKNGLERKLSLNWSTVNAEVKALLESGKAVYDGEKLVGGPDGVDAYLIAKFTKRG